MMGNPETHKWPKFRVTMECPVLNGTCLSLKRDTETEAETLRDYDRIEHRKKAEVVAKFC